MKSLPITILMVLITLISFLKVMAQNEAYFDQMFAHYHQLDSRQAGIGIAVIKDQEIVYKRTFGY